MEIIKKMQQSNDNIANMIERKQKFVKKPKTLK